MLVWGDGQTQQGIRHLNFHLINSGECVILSKPNSSFSDSVCYTNIPDDYSYGRINDGNASWMNFVIPTPDSNNVDLYVNLPDAQNKLELSIYPNPIHEGVVFVNQNISGTLSDLQGRDLIYFRNTNHFNLSGFSRGVYIINTSDHRHLKITVE